MAFTVSLRVLPFFPAGVESTGPLGLFPGRCFFSSGFHLGFFPRLAGTLDEPVAFLGAFQRGHPLAHRGGPAGKERLQSQEGSVPTHARRARAVPFPMFVGRHVVPEGQRGSRRRLGDGDLKLTDFRAVLPRQLQRTRRIRFRARGTEPGAHSRPAFPPRLCRPSPGGKPS